MTTPDWQKGFPIAQLKELAEPFKIAHKALVFGAFGLTKERDIADALAHKRLIWTGSPPQAVAIFSQLKRPFDQQDFTQRSYRLARDTVVVKSFAATSVASGVKVLNALKERAPAQLVVEIFEEDKVARECVDQVGWFYGATKISAGSEIKGVYSGAAVAPALPVEELASLEVLTPNYVSKDHHAMILKELAVADSMFAQHYSDYNKRKSWTSFALRGYSDDPTFIIKPGEMSKAWKEDNAALLAEKPRATTIVKNFPATMKIVDGLQLKLDRVRFMRLRSKDGELSRHADITDREAGTRDGFITRLHIPIVTSEAVTFYSWNARGLRREISLPERALCYLDQRKPHAVKNTDPKLDRIHLVIDCFADENLRKKIAKSLRSG